VRPINGSVDADSHEMLLNVQKLQICPSPTNISPKFNDSIILVLEPTNDTFSFKRICLSDNTPVKIGRITNKNTHQTQTNGYFDSRVLSRTHVEILNDNGNVKDDPVELKNFDLL
ncbi:45238_t:CDS:2, partial [Gigaspora margarita]